MYDKMQDKLRVAFQSAHRLAVASGESKLDTRSVLLGLVAAGENTIAARALKEVGLWATIVAEAACVMEKGGSEVPIGVPLCQTETVREMMDLAVVRSLDLNHHYIGTEHVLLGLIDTDRFLQEVLRKTGKSGEAIWQAIQTILGIDVNTDEDYKNHRIAIEGMLGQCDDAKTGVKAVFAYLRSKMPP